MEMVERILLLQLESEMMDNVLGAFAICLHPELHL